MRSCSISRCWSAPVSSCPNAAAATGSTTSTPSPCASGTSDGFNRWKPPASPNTATSGPTPPRSRSLPIADPRSCRGGQLDVSGAVRGHDPAIGKNLARVVKHDHSVAQQAPSLLGVGDYNAGGISVPAVSQRTRGLMCAHGVPPGTIAVQAGYIQTVMVEYATTSQSGSRLG